MMPAEREGNGGALPSSVHRDIAVQVERFEQQWLTGHRPDIEQFLTAVRASGKSELFAQLLVVEVRQRSNAGEVPTAHDYHSRFPQHADSIKQVFDQTRTNRQQPDVEQADAKADERKVFDDFRISEASGQQERPAQAPDGDTREHEPSARQDADAIPAAIGRYQVEKWLGGGGFGSVYLAYDPKMDRRVAVKVLRSDFRRGVEERVTARLDHRNIVPVYDVGETENGCRYIVSKYIEGANLAQRLKEQRLSYLRFAEIMETVAEALRYAHSEKIIHRDIKPDNILIDTQDVVYLAEMRFVCCHYKLLSRKETSSTVYM